MRWVKRRGTGLDCVSGVACGQSRMYTVLYNQAARAGSKPKRPRDGGEAVFGVGDRRIALEQWRS